MEIPPINQRVNELIKEYAMENVSRFAREIGVFPQVLSRLFKPDPRSGQYPTPSMTIVNSIVNKFGDINREWLITGEGEKKKNVDIAKTENNSSLQMEMARMKWAIEQLRETIDKIEKERNEAIREAVKWQTIVEQQQLISKEGQSSDQLPAHRKTG